MNKLQQACRTLGVSPDASRESIEAAYRQKQRDFQHDPGADPWNFQEVQQAYDLACRYLVNASPSTKSQIADDKSELKLRSSLASKPISEPTANGQASDVPRHLVWQAFFRKLPLQNETATFVLVNVLDIFMTYGLLRFGGIETNPIANYFLHRWGFDGMIFLKMLSVALVTVLAQLIAVRDLPKARRLLIAGTLIVFGVVVYSGFLLMRVLR